MSYVDQATTALKITNITADIATLEDSIAGNMDVESYTIAGKSLSRYSLKEKQELHAWLSNKLDVFQAEQDIADSAGRASKIVPKF